MTVAKIGAVGTYSIMAPLQAHPQWIQATDLPASVNCDGANGLTLASPERARSLGLEVDGDEPVALACYHLGDFGPQSLWPHQLIPHRAAFGLDAPESGGNSPTDAWGWVVQVGQPVLQGPYDPAPGYLVSTTALRQHGKPEEDPTAYFDSAGAPGFVLPGHDLERYGVALGDFAVVEFGGTQIYVQAYDSGNAGLVELSQHACTELGIPDCGRKGGVSGGVRITMFPRSRAQLLDVAGRPRPGTADEIKQAGARAAAAAGYEVE